MNIENINKQLSQANIKTHMSHNTHNPNITIIDSQNQAIATINIMRINKKEQLELIVGDYRNFGSDISFIHTPHDADILIKTIQIAKPYL